MIGSVEPDRTQRVKTNFKVSEVKAETLAHSPQGLGGGTAVIP